MKNAGKNDDYSSIADVDALLLPAGDPAGEDEPMRKGTAFQVSTKFVSHGLGISEHLRGAPDRRGSSVMSFHQPSYFFKRTRCTSSVLLQKVTLIALLDVIWRSLTYDSLSKNPVTNSEIEYAGSSRDPSSGKSEGASNGRITEVLGGLYITSTSWLTNQGGTHGEIGRRMEEGVG